MEIKRLTAKKASIDEIIKGRFLEKPGFESNYVLTRLGRKLSRIRIMGLVVDKFVSEDKNYATVTLDDTTETIRCKIFKNISLLDGIEIGNLVDVIGKVREYNDEIYIVPEIIKNIEDKNMETLRLLELAKIWKEQKKKIEKIRELKKQTSDKEELKRLANISKEDLESILEAEDLIDKVKNEKIEKSRKVKDEVLDFIGKYKKGVEYQEILSKLDFPENDIDIAIQELLEDGICFEPNPGKIRKV